MNRGSLGRTDGTAVTATETTNDPKGQFQTFVFTGLQSLTPQGGLPQFDNVVLNAPAASPAPEPSQMAGLGFTVLGLGSLRTWQS